MDDQEREASRRRRLVYHALADVVDESTLQQILQLLHAEFPPATMFSANKFLQRLDAQVTLGARRGEVFARLTRGALLPLDQLGFDPRAAVAVEHTPAPRGLATPPSLSSPPVAPPPPALTPPPTGQVTYHRGRRVT